MKKLRSIGYHVWTPEEEELVKEKFGKESVGHIAEEIGVSRGSVYGKIKRMYRSMSKLSDETSEKILDSKDRRTIANIQNSQAARWTDSEINYLINNYSRKTRKDVSEKLNKSLSAVDSKARSLKMQGKFNAVQLPIDFSKEKVSQNNFKKSNTRWSKKEIKYLKENIEEKSLKEISSYLQRTEAAVTFKYYELKRKRKITNVKGQKKQEAQPKHKVNIKNILLVSLISFNILCVIAFLLHFLI